MKVANLEGQALDFWVAKADGRFRDQLAGYFGLERDCPFTIDLWTKLKASQEYRPSTDWAIGGPIIERERIGVVPHARQPGMWAVPLPWSDEHESVGPTPLVAAMRAFVARKFGEDVPDENLSSP